MSLISGVAIIRHQNLSMLSKIRYHGIDRSRNYNLDQNDFAGMEFFYKIDLAKGNLSPVPNDFFDVIILSHVIEHITNGEEVVIQITRKIKRGGIIYIEFPTVKSTRFPRMKNHFVVEH